MLLLLLRWRRFLVVALFGVEWWRRSVRHVSVEPLLLAAVRFLWLINSTCQASGFPHSCGPRRLRTYLRSSSRRSLGTGEAAHDFGIAPGLLTMSPNAPVSAALWWPSPGYAVVMPLYAEDQCLGSRSHCPFSSLLVSPCSRFHQK